VVDASTQAQPQEATASALADPERFRAFYAEALPRVYGYFYSRLGADAALVEDLTQETFLAAVAELRRGTRVVAPVPWILGVARHKFLDHLRLQQRRGWTLLSWEESIIDEEIQVPEDDDMARDLAIAALAAVPAWQREALVIRYLDGMSVPEVAASVGRSVDATESLLARGRISFRRALQEVEHDV
jgi:RNA polymerase sigma-70 factor (ECF subfamily)